MYLSDFLNFQVSILVSTSEILYESGYSGHLNHDSVYGAAEQLGHITATSSGHDLHIIHNATPLFNHNMSHMWNIIIPTQSEPEKLHV